ncbi:MAG: GyrI-like domain-containing protein [Candidatus Saccharimonadales bacterium]
MEKIDFKRLFKACYSPKAGQPEIITIPKMQYLMVDGRGDPNESVEFQNAIGALYSTVYGLKFGRKKAGQTPDFSIGPLQALWWTNSDQPFSSNQKQDWHWTAMIWLPDFISSQDVKQQVDLTKAKKPNPALTNLRLENFDEATVVQLMHIGPYSQEQADIELMHKFALNQGYRLSGKHHEIYLGDPRRAAAEKLRTILRQPIRRQP